MANGLTKRFTALSRIDVQVMPGEPKLVCCISGILPIDASSVTLRNQRTDGMAPRRRTRLGPAAQ